MTVLAIDLGAESGRVMAVEHQGKRLHLHEVHRFVNRPVEVRGRLHWNLLGLWSEIQDGIRRSREHVPVSLGVDTWAVDFGLLDAAGELLGNPVHYRDRRTEGMMEEVFQRIDRSRIFAETGIQFMPINTLYQLMGMVHADDPRLCSADTFLTVPDLLHYWLTGEKACEFTNATTTQLYNARKQQWSRPILEALGLSERLFPTVVPPGTRLGRYEGLEVIAPASHDTGSAVAGVPTESSGFAYISSGTWSLVGVEVAEPIMTDAALAANVTNEGGVEGTFRLLKNVMGLWILQQCRGVWQENGHTYAYKELVQMAKQAPELRSFVPVDHQAFLQPGDHAALIRRLCKETDQPVPNAPGEVVRCVLESLALAYRQVLDTLEALTGQAVDVIHVVGGGAKNELLCQMTANAGGHPVIAGPTEATVLGNAAVQFMALGELESLADARRCIAASSNLKHYEPQDQERWEDAYDRYQMLFT